ncbi:MAG: arylamine N-acetyltransferase, partial [Bacillota bacterium]|nr:arylamine N-acetyltransferase [Bacillota bacterium]
MPNETVNIDTYFKRIKYSGKKDVSFETLYGLHTAHTLNVPFENLDVYLGRPVSLDPDSLYTKMWLSGLDSKGLQSTRMF